jgi:superfamily I DNA and RNA helicase
MAGMPINKTGASVVPLTVPLYKEFGLVQITLAQMQERFSHLAEKLIENKKPFKKASRQQLTDALSTMQAIERALNEQEKRVRGVGGRFCKIAGADGPDRMTVLREFEHVITADRKAMQGFYDQLNRSECLKNS